MSVEVVMSGKGPTVRDVAKLAGVSPISVSRVCNPDSRFTVSDQIRERILKAVEELNYRPNVAARSLRTRRVGSVAFYDTYGLIWLSDRLSSEIFIGLQLGCADRQQELLVVRPMLAATQHEVARALSQTKSDAIVCLPGWRNAALIAELGQGSKAVVQIGEACEGAPAVVADDYEASKLLAHHLKDRGHRKIMYLRDTDNHISAQRRYAGFVAEANRLGIEIVPIHVIPGRGDLNEEVKLLLADRTRNGISAVVGWHDYAAVRVLHHCREVGIRVPEDIAVAGFDGLMHRETPAGLTITTLSVDWRGIARTAVNMAVDIVLGKDAPDECVLQAPLTIGNTT